MNNYDQLKHLYAMQSLLYTTIARKENHLEYLENEYKTRININSVDLAVLYCTIQFLTENIRELNLIYDDLIKLSGDN